MRNILMTAALLFGVAGSAFGDDVLGYVTLQVNAPDNQWGVTSSNSFSGETALGPYNYTLTEQSIPASGSLISQGAQDLFNSSVFSPGSTTLTLNGYCIQLTADIYVGENYSDFAVVPLGSATSPIGTTAAEEISWLRTTYSGNGSGPVVPTASTTNPTYPYALGLAIWDVLNNGLSLTLNPTSGDFGVSTLWGTTTTDGTFGGDVQSEAKTMLNAYTAYTGPSTVSPDLYALVGDAQDQSIALAIDLENNGSPASPAPEPSACVGLLGLALSFGGATLYRRWRG